MIFFKRKNLPWLGLLANILLGILFSVRATGAEMLSDKGLPSRNITGVCKDNRGLMWISTSSGLCTYDGYDFAPLQGNAVLQGVCINSILYDEHNDLLWIASAKGLYSIQCSTLKIQESTSGTAWQNQPVACMLMNREGHVFACIQTGALIEATKERPVKYLAQIPFSKVADDSPSWIFGKEDRLTIGLLKHTDLFEFRLKEKRLLTIGPGSFKVTPEIERIPHGLLFHTSEGSDRQWSLSGKGRAAGMLARKLLQLDDIQAIHFLSDTIAYIITRPCLVYKVNFSEQKWGQVNEKMFSGLKANSTFLDAHQLLWIGTNKGLVKITTENLLFKTELVQTPPVSVRSLSRDDAGNLYCGTYSGLFRKSGTARSWTRISRETPMAMLDVPGPYLYFVKEQEKTPLYRIDKHSGRIESGFYRTALSPADKIRSGYSLAVANSGTLWIGMNSGIAKYNPGTRTVDRVQGWSDKAPGVRYIQWTAEQRAWLCTSRGLYLVDTTGKILGHWHTGSKPALTANTINHITEDTAGRYWLCTEGGGINILSKDRQRVTILERRHGLSDNATCNIMWQGDNAWISTYSGLSRYNLKDKTFYNFYTEDGISDNECNRNAFWQDSPGRMYFGTVNGINSFYPETLAQSGKQATLLAATITKWDHVAHRYVNLPVPASGAPLIMGPWDHSLLLNLTLDDYAHPERSAYSYRIKNLSKDWITMQHQHSIQLNGLQPGTYTLEIMAMDGHGRMAVNKLLYQLRVQTPFFRSWWFYSMLLLSAVLLLYGLVWLRFNRLRQLLRLRRKIASDLHDDVGSLLTRITMTSDHLLLGDPTGTPKSEKLQKISFLSRMASSSMRDILWAIDTRNDFSGNLADRMQEHAAEMLSPLNCDIVFTIAIKGNRNISPEIRQQLYLIFKESINNIVKHSEAKKVSVTYRYHKKTFLLHITNDGIREGSLPDSRGQGLKNIKMRAGHIRATATVRQEGNLFEVIISRQL